MKNYVVALTLLVLLCILSAGCIELEFLNLNFAVFEDPAASVCTSPAAKLAESAGLDRDHCYQQVALNTDDLSLCDMIERGAPMTKCYCLIASKKNDPSVCDEVPATSDLQAYLRTDCLWEVAIRNNNPDACTAMGTQKISRMFIGEMSQTTCLARLASGQGVGESTL